MNYSKLVTRQKKYKYSANICFDMKNDEKLAGFIPNQTTTEILAEYLYGIIENIDSVHSRILYGSYGTGKSHLLTVLALLLGHTNTDGEAFEKFVDAIRQYDPTLAEFITKYNSEEKPYLVVPVYSDFDSFDQCISYSLKKELCNQGINVQFDNYYSEAQNLIQKWESGADSKKRLVEVCKACGINLKNLKRLLNEMDSSSEPLFSEVFKGMSYGASFVSGFGNLLENINKANEAISDTKRGIVFIFDEFGRYLEDVGESLKVKSIQNLAELCDHGDYNNHIILVSHKQLSLYTNKMRKDLNDEWKKVEGRFVSTSINSKYDQCLSLIPSIIPKTKAWDKFSRQFEKELKDVSDIAWRFKGFVLPDNAEEDPFIGGFPLNPITLFSLDKLSKKVAQNERTFFTYLSTDEPNSLFDQLERLDTNEFHFIGLDALFDYFEPNIKSYRSPEVSNLYKKYLMAKNKIGTLENNAIELKLIKAITVISIIGDTDTLCADENTLTYVIDENNDKIVAAIDRLISKKVLRLMRQFGYYDFLDGSIFDFELMIDEQANSVTMDAAINSLNQEFRDFVIYPHRYNQAYHTNRLFIPVFVKKEDLVKKSFKRMLPDFYDGVLAFVLDNEYKKSFYTKNADKPDRCICVVNWETDEIVSEVKRYIAIQYLVSKKAEFSEKDPTAEAELLLYLDEQRTVVTNLVSHWRNLSNDSIAVCVNDKIVSVKSVKELSEIASRMMEQEFDKTLIVNNDLINKNNVSGAIKQAREKALSIIINEKDIIASCNKLSPEHTIIRSVLSKNGLCVDEDVLKKDLNPSNAQVYSLIKRYIKKCIKAKRSLSELYDSLKNPPYGLRDGYISILIANALREHENVSLYFHEEERDYNAPTLLEALEHTNDYTLYICDWDEEQKQYIFGLENLFSNYLSADTKNRLKELFNAMTRHFTAISKSARTTDKYVSDKTKLYRDLLSLTHKDYNTFFFEELFALGKDYDEILSAISNAKQELETVVNKQVFSLSQMIKKTMGGDSSISWKKLKKMLLPIWNVKKQRLLDYQINSVFEVIELEESDNDFVWANKITNAVIGFEIEYCNDDKETEIQESLERIMKQLNGVSNSESASENEIKIVLEDEGNTKTALLDNSELSSMSQVMFNKMKTTIDNFGQSLSPEEKVRVLAKLLSEMM